ncbi:hypothetical protein D3C81_1621770 [compost metagenome]
MAGSGPPRGRQRGAHLCHGHHGGLQGGRAAGAGARPGALAVRCGAAPAVPGHLHLAPGQGVRAPSHGAELVRAAGRDHSGGRRLSGRPLRRAGQRSALVRHDLLRPDAAADALSPHLQPRGAGCRQADHRHPGRPCQPLLGRLPDREPGSVAAAGGHPARDSAPDDGHHLPGLRQAAASAVLARVCRLHLPAGDRSHRPVQGGSPAGAVA